MDNDVLEKLRALQDILARKNELETEILDAPKALTQQEELLEKLKNTRKSGNKKGLVVAATGTGKTYLAAMDIKIFFEKT